MRRNFYKQQTVPWSDQRASMLHPCGAPTKPLTRDVEQVQWRTARFINNNYHDTSPGCVTRLLLLHRRTIHRLDLWYKIRNHLVDIDPEKYYIPGDRQTRGSHRIRQPQASKEEYRYSIFLRSRRTGIDFQGHLQQHLPSKSSGLDSPVSPGLSCTMVDDIANLTRLDCFDF